MHMNKKEKDSKGPGIATSLAAATAAALATYYLYGTEHGEKTRGKIKDAAKDVAGKAKDKAMELKDKAMEMKDRATAGGNELAQASKEVFSDMTGLLKERYEDLKNLDKEDINALADRLRERWEEISEDIEDTLEKARGKKEAESADSSDDDSDEDEDSDDK